MEYTEKSTIPPFQKELTLGTGADCKMLLETTFFRYPVNTKVAAYHLKYDEDGCDALFSKARFGEEDAPSGFHVLSPQAKGFRAKEKPEQSTMQGAMKGPMLGTFDPL